MLEPWICCKLICSIRGWVGVWTPFVYGVITGSALGFTFEILHKIFSAPPIVPSKLSQQIPFNRDKATTNSCAICMEDFKAEELVTFLSCTHLYHSWCIILWFKKKQNCPLCRKNIKIGFLRQN